MKSIYRTHHAGQGNMKASLPADSLKKYMKQVYMSGGNPAIGTVIFPMPKDIIAFTFSTSRFVAMKIDCDAKYLNPVILLRDNY